MISCESCRELLPEFSLGELEARDRKKVKFHLQKCRGCAVELAEYRRVWSVLPLALDPVEPPQTVKVQLMDRVQKSPRVDRSKRRDRQYETTRARRAGSFDEQRWRRYLVAALILVGVFAFTSFYGSGEEDPQMFAKDATINHRVKRVAMATGHHKSIITDSGSNFVYVDLNRGSAYDSLDSKGDSYAVLNKLMDKWTIVANSLNEAGSDNYKLWLLGKDGSLLSSSNLVVREFGNTQSAIQLPTNQPFARAMITLESNPSAKRPSSEVVFDGALIRPIEQPVELEQ